MTSAGNGSNITMDPSITDRAVVSGWPEPHGAVEILPAGAQHTHPDAWAAARMDGIGGSDVPAIIGATSFESPFGLWLTKTGRRPPISDNGRMQRGRYLEPALAQFFADTTGLALRRTGTWARAEVDPTTGQIRHGWMRCNPDRLVADGGLAEIKAPNHADWANLWADGPAVHAVTQLMWCLAVCGIGHGYVIADGPDGLRWWRVDRSLDIERWLIGLAAPFWFHNVVEDCPPDVDGSEATLIAIKEASQPPTQLAPNAQVTGCSGWAIRRRDLKTAIAAAEAELKEIENRFKAALIGAVTAMDGTTPVLSWPWVALETPKPYRRLGEPKNDRS